jgi:hypothetical protein
MMDGVQKPSNYECYTEPFRFYEMEKGARGGVVVKALSYMPECRGLETRWGEFLNLPNPSGISRPWGLLSF